MAHYEQPAGTTKYLCYLITAFQLPNLYSTTYGIKAHGGALVEALRYKRKVMGSIPDGVTGIFH